MKKKLIAILLLCILTFTACQEEKEFFYESSMNVSDWGQISMPVSDDFEDVSLNVHLEIEDCEVTVTVLSPTKDVVSTATYASSGDYTLELGDLESGDYMIKAEANEEKSINISFSSGTAE